MAPGRENPAYLIGYDTSTWAWDNEDKVSYTAMVALSRQLVEAVGDIRDERHT